MSKLDEIRKKHQREDLLFVGMGMATLDLPEEQKKEDLKTYKNFIQPLKKQSFKILLKRSK